MIYLKSDRIPLADKAIDDLSKTLKVLSSQLYINGALSELLPTWNLHPLRSLKWALP
jgi:hypothetical protein